MNEERARRRPRAQRSRDSQSLSTALGPVENPWPPLDILTPEGLQRIVDAGRGRVGAPLEFVRSLYLLGQINEQTGDRAKATAYYRRFVQYWGDGDMDRDKIAEAKKKIAGS